MRTIARSSVPLALSLLLACGGKAAPRGEPVGNTVVAGSAAAAEPSPVPVGIHGCQFIVDNQPYGPHRCDVGGAGGSTLEKVSGMETFTATLSEKQDELVVTGTMGCGDMVTACHQTFTATLHKENGAWKGPVVSEEGKPDWWLNGATFELDDDTGYGGARYGGGRGGAGE
jgi:hypothetical protein